MANREQEEATWVTAVKAGAVLGCHAQQIPGLARKGLLTVRKVPGCDPRYLLSDVERLARQSTTPAAHSGPDEAIGAGAGAALGSEGGTTRSPRAGTPEGS